MDNNKHFTAEIYVNKQGSWVLEINGEFYAMASAVEALLPYLMMEAMRYEPSR